MSFLTIRTDGVPDQSQQRAIDRALHAFGARVRRNVSHRVARSYALVESQAERHAEIVAATAANGATAYDPPVIALAVFPAVAEALPHVMAALGGAGRPDGVRSCEPCDGGCIVEWDLERTPAAVVLGLVDLELRRFNSGRTAELLTPLPPAWIARIAADGLQAPELTPERILEELIERANLHV